MEITIELNKEFPIYFYTIYYYYKSYPKLHMSYVNESTCYDSRLKVLSQETTLVLSNTRELDRVPSTE